MLVREMEIENTRGVSAPRERAEIGGRFRLPFWFFSSKKPCRKLLQRVPLAAARDEPGTRERESDHESPRPSVKYTLRPLATPEYFWDTRYPDP